MKWLVAMVLTMALTGCLNTDSGPVTPAEGEPDGTPLPGDLPGTLILPVPASPWTPWWLPCDWTGFEPSPERGGWMDRKVLHIAHQGGENEVPSATMYALKTSLIKGADLLEIDVHVTADGHIVVLHDTTVDRTTDGTGAVEELTLAQIKELDAAYWFVPERGRAVTPDANDTAYLFRGMRTGERDPPPGCTPEDFTIPTLREVLEEFPDVMMNIEIKNGPPQGRGYEEALASLLAEFGRGSDTIVASFVDTWTETFRAFNADVDTSTGTGQTAIAKALSESALPGSPTLMHDAFQVPIEFEGVEVVTADFVKDAHANGMAVHVWTINDPDEMRWLIDIGVDGIMTAAPAVLESVLIEKGVQYT